MNTKVISFLLSLVAVPAIFIGSFLGGIFAELFYGTWVYQNVPEHVISLGAPIISGGIGGYLAGFIIFKIYNNVDWKVASAIPFAYAIPAAYVHIWGYFNDVAPLSFISTFGLIMGVIAAPYVYLNYLKERVSQKHTH